MPMILLIAAMVDWAAGVVVKPYPSFLVFLDADVVDVVGDDDALVVVVAAAVWHDSRQIAIFVAPRAV